MMFSIKCVALAMLFLTHQNVSAPDPCSLVPAMCISVGRSPASSSCPPAGWVVAAGEEELEDRDAHFEVVRGVLPAGWTLWDGRRCSFGDRARAFCHLPTSRTEERAVGWVFFFPSIRCSTRGGLQLPRGWEEHWRSLSKYSFCVTERFPSPVYVRALGAQCGCRASTAVSASN